MKGKYFLVLTAVFFLLFLSHESMGQCSICTKVAADQGVSAIKGLNMGILYLLAVPLSLVGFLGYRFYKSNAEENEPEQRG